MFVSSTHTNFMCCFVLQAITISVHDVSEPQPLALPHYHGELYIYVALVLGGIWMFATVPLIVMLGVLVVSGQPPIHTARL